MTIGLTYHELKALRPCEDSFERITKLIGGPRKWNGKTVDAAAARAAGCSFNDIVWAASALSRINPDVKRKLRLWIADCAARVLQIYEKQGASGAPRNAITAARQFARGEIDDAARAAASDAASDAAWAAASDAASDAARAAAWAAASDAARAAAGAAAWDAEQDWQFDRLIEWLSNDEPKDLPLPGKQKATA